MAGWAVVAFAIGGHVATLPIPESCAARARVMGWTVVIQDADLMPEVEPAQSNPRRVSDDG